jgi:hypothetical protein
MGVSKKEDLLFVLYSMLKILPQEQAQIKAAREGLSAQQVKESAKKGVFSMFGVGQKK